MSLKQIVPRRMGFSIVALLLAFMLAVPATVVHAASNLVAHWAFDETGGTVATDSSGSGQDGTNTNATISPDVPTTTFANPRSLSFDGSSSVVDAPPQSALTGNHSRTISLWFKTAYDSQNQPLFDSGGIGTDTAMQIYTVAAGGAGLAPPTNPGGIAVVMWDNDIYVPLGIANVADNQWHYLTFTYDEATQQSTLYFDGIAEQAYLWDGASWSASLESQPFTTADPLNTTANDVLIGQSRSDYFGSGTTFFTGNIDDVRIYDIAITPEQVSNLSSGSNDPSVPASTSSSTSASSDPAVPGAPDTGFGPSSDSARNDVLPQFLASMFVAILVFVGTFVFRHSNR